MGSGHVRAETIQAAVALTGHPEVNVYPLPADAVWPGDPGEAVWRCVSRMSRRRLEADEGVNFAFVPYPDIGV